MMAMPMEGSLTTWNASHRFEQLAKQPPPPTCTDAHYARVVKLASLLGYAAEQIAAGNHGRKHTWCRAHDNPGDCGMFSTDYKDVKTRFLYDEMCQRFSNVSGPINVCELGFMKGQTSLLFLEVSGRSRVSTFDLGDFQWSAGNARLLRHVYGSRFVATFGSSHSTLPAFFAQHPHRKCHAALIDGDKTRGGRLADLRAVRRVSVSTAALFFDEVTSLACVSDAEKCVAACEADSKRGKSGVWGGATLAYCDAVRQQLFTMDRCAWPPHLQDADGICVATSRGGKGA